MKLEMASITWIESLLNLDLTWFPLHNGKCAILHSSWTI